MTDRTPHGFPRTSLGLQAEAWSSGPLYPDVHVVLVGRDGNAFAILGAVEGALRKAGHADAIQAFRDEATSADYEHLLATCVHFVDVS